MTPGESPLTVTRLVHAWAERQPHAAAVRLGEHSLTYAQLDASAGRLAGQLRELPATRSTVGVRLDHDLALPAAILAVLRAGHTCVPVGASGPTPPALIGHGAGLDPRMPSRGGGVFADIDPAGGRYAICDALTSGAALGGLLTRVAATIGLVPGRRMLVPAPATTVRGAVDLLLPLAAGAELALADPEDAADLARLAALIGRLRPTHLHGTPLIWANLLARGADLAGMTVLVSGEQLPGRLAARLLAAAPAVWNVFGPAEHGGYATLWPVRTPPAPPAGPPQAIAPVGTPVPGATAVIYDAALRTVPDGTAGDLYLGGPYLATGYLTRPHIDTVRAFRPDPRAGAPGDRLLYTGMLASRRPDGTVEIHGRAEDRLTGRGSAVDPDQVAAALADLPDLAQAVVTVRRDASGDPILVAYLVAESGPAHSLEVEAALVLSGSLLPYRIVFCPYLPMAADGTVDRDRLPDPDAASTPAPQRAPTGHEEETIAAVWVELLGIATPSAEASFFEVGGYSLAVTRLGSRLEEAFGIHVPVAELFVHTTVAAQAALVERLYDEHLADLTDLTDDEDGTFADLAVS